MNFQNSWLVRALHQIKVSDFVSFVRQMTGNRIIWYPGFVQIFVKYYPPEGSNAKLQWYVIYDILDFDLFSEWRDRKSKNLELNNSVD